MLRFSGTPPNDAFRSLTNYDAGSKLLVANPLDRFKVGSDTKGLEIAGDGSFEIPLSATEPSGDFAANWLPAPEGEFYVILRIYQPQDAVISGDWSLPQVEKIQ